MTRHFRKYKSGCVHLVCVCLWPSLARGACHSSYGRPVLIGARIGSDSHGGSWRSADVGIQHAVVAGHMSQSAFQETPDSSFQASKEICRRCTACRGVFSNFRSMPPRVCCMPSRGSRICTAEQPGDTVFCKCKAFCQEEDEMRRSTLSIMCLAAMLCLGLARPRPWPLMVSWPIATVSFGEWNPNATNLIAWGSATGQIGRRP